MFLLKWTRKKKPHRCIMTSRASIISIITDTKLQLIQPKIKSLYFLNSEVHYFYIFISLKVRANCIYLTGSISSISTEIIWDQGFKFSATDSIFKWWKYGKFGGNHISHSWLIYSESQTLSNVGQGPPQPGLCPGPQSRFSPHACRLEPYAPGLNWFQVPNGQVVSHI